MNNLALLGGVPLLRGLSALPIIGTIASLLSGGGMTPGTESIINSAWTEAPFSLSFVHGLNRPLAYYSRSRKRRRHWDRQIWRRFRERIPNPTPKNALPGYEYMGELEWHYAAHERNGAV